MEKPRCSRASSAAGMRQTHIGRLLTGIVEQTFVDREIIIVDSGSTDATLSIASRYPVRVLHISPNEFSFGRSLNKGCQAASGEFIVIASGHVTRFTGTGWNGSWRPSPTHRWRWSTASSGATGQPSTPSTRSLPGGTRTNRTRRRTIHSATTPMPPSAGPHGSSCPSMKSLTGLEDLAWAGRAMELGHRIVYAPEAEVVHAHNETFGQIYNRYRREAIAMKRIFPQEHFTLWNFLGLFPGNTLCDWQHARQDQVLRRNLLSIAAFRLMQFWGTYRGYRQRSPVTEQVRQKFYYPNNASHLRSDDRGLEAARRIEYSGTPTENDVDRHD